MKTLIYVIGEPGAGKSTAMRKATEHFGRHPQQAPFAHDLLVSESAIVAAELGKRRPTFSGTDALPMNVITKAERFLYETLAPVVLAEGARLGCRRFLEAAVEAGYQTHLLYLTTPHAAAQRAARPGEQKPSWVKGAATRAENLANTQIDNVALHRIDGSTQDAAAYIKALIDKAEES